MPIRISYRHILRHNSNPEKIIHNVRNGQTIIVDDIVVEHGEYYFIKVHQSNSFGDPNNNTEGDDGWSSPIWITVDMH